MATGTQVTQSLSSAVSLATSVSSLRSSLSLLDSSISILDEGINDFPRLSAVLSGTRHFELTPASNLAAAQASLASELGPAIMALLSRVEVECARLERRENALLARSELLEGRLGMGSERKAGSGATARTEQSAKENETAIRLKALRQKKERLGYAVERLTLQSQQRQRQLRMSINASAP